MRNVARAIWLGAATAVVALVIAGVAFVARDRSESELTFRLESFNINLDPAFISDTQSRRVVDMLHARLLGANEKGEFSPQLADSWSWAGDKRLRLKLNSQWTFATGKRVTAEDVRFSLCRLVQPGAPYGWLFSNIRSELNPATKTATCTGIGVIDDTTLEIEVTTDPDRLLPSLASSTAAIVPAGSRPGEYGVIPGAGPYQLDQISPGAKILLRRHAGGPVKTNAARAAFQLVQDDSVAATLFKAGKLDALEISNPTLMRLLVGNGGAGLRKGVRQVETDVHQVRVLIFNFESIAKALGIGSKQAAQWVGAYSGRIDTSALVKHFPSLAIPIQTSYFPARKISSRSRYQGPQPSGSGRLQIISEADAYSDAIAAQLPTRLGAVEVTHIGLEKSLLISRLIKKEFDIASISLEAMLAHRAYWLAFFQPHSPFTIFGIPIDAIDQTADDPARDQAIAELIDTRGNWFILFQERRVLLLQPWITGESFLATGLVNYATMETRR